MINKGLLTKLAGQCSRREYCVSQIEEKLRKINFMNEEYSMSDSDMREIVEVLKKNKYISNRRFAEAYVNDKLVFNGWGGRKIIYGLSVLKIDKEDINAAMDEVYYEKKDKVIEKLMVAKFKQLKNEQFEMAKIKVVKYMLGKGFDYEEVSAKIPIFAPK